jgi:hypothetical protein
MAYKSEFLEQTVTYSGEAISVRALEELIGGERLRQNEQVDELTRMHQRNSDLQSAPPTFARTPKIQTRATQQARRHVHLAPVGQEQRDHTALHRRPASQTI